MLRQPLAGVNSHCSDYGRGVPFAASEHPSGGYTQTNLSAAWSQLLEHPSTTTVCSTRVAAPRGARSGRKLTVRDIPCGIGYQSPVCALSVWDDLRHGDIASVTIPR
jgi:hypothetical protein